MIVTPTDNFVESPRCLAFIGDPVGFVAGDANLYRYVGNDPVNMIDPDGQVEYSVGKRFKYGKVSQDGKSFILDTAIQNANGNPQKKVPIRNGTLDFSAFSVAEVEVAITGKNSFDQAEARKIFERDYKELFPDRLKKNYMFHHDGISVRTEIVNGEKVVLGKLQVVPKSLNARAPHSGSAADARLVHGQDPVSKKRARYVARKYNAASSGVRGAAKRISLRGVAVLNVYMSVRDVLMTSGAIVSCE